MLRAEAYLTILSSISIFLVIINWNNTTSYQYQLKKVYRINSDDFKIVTSPDKDGHRWLFGEIRRNPLKQKFKNVSFEDLPKFSEINTSLHTPDLIGTINRTNQVSKSIIIVFNICQIFMGTVMYLQ